MKSLSIIVALAVATLAGRPAGAVEPTVAVLPPHQNLQGDVARMIDQIRSDVASALDEAGYAALPAERAETCKTSFTACKRAF